MLIQMSTNMACEKYSCAAGDVIEVDDTDAAAFIKGGYATAVGTVAAPVEAAPVESPEVAAALNEGVVAAPADFKRQQPLVSGRKGK